MNSYFFQKVNLITNEDTRSLAHRGFTGSFSGVDRARDITIVSRYFGSGNARVTVQGKSPTNDDEAYNILQLDYAGSSGYLISGITLPHTDLKAVITGSGVWDVTAIIQN